MAKSTLLCLLFIGLYLPLFSQGTDSGSLEKGYRYFADKQYSQAVKQLNEALSADPTGSFQPSARLTLGKAYLALNQPEEAKRETERVIREYPDFSALDSVWLVLAMATEQAGQQTTAAELYEQLANKYPLSPLSPESLLKAGRLHRRLSNTKDAQRVLQRLVNEYPNVPDQLQAQFELGELLFRLGDMESARSRFLTILTHPSVNQEQKNGVNLRLTDLFLSLKDPASAENYLKQVTVSSTDTLQSRIQLLTNLIKIQNNQWEEGLPTASSLLTANSFSPPDFFRTGLFLARTYRQLQKYAESLDWYQRLLPLADAENSTFQIQLEGAEVFELAGNQKRALEWVVAANKNAGDSRTPRSLVLEARLRQATGAYKEAMLVYELFLNRFPSHPETDRVRYELAVLASRELNIRSRALEYLSPLLSGSMKSFYEDDAAFLTGLLYLESGFTGDAFQIWSGFEEKYPGSELISPIRSIMDTLTLSRLNSREFASGLVALAADLNPGNPTGKVHYSIGKLIYSTGLSLTTAIDHLKRGLDSKDLTQIQREDALYMLAKIYEELGNRNETIATIKTYQQFYSNQPRARELQDIYIHLLIEQASLTDLPEIENLIRLHQDVNTRVKLSTELEKKRFLLDEKSPFIANLSKLDLKSVSPQTAGFVRRTQAEFYSEGGDTSSAIRYWQELSQSKWGPDAEWGLARLISTGTRYFPVQDRYVFLNNYLERFYYSEFALKVRILWLQTSLQAGLTDVAFAWCRQYVAGERLFTEEQDLYELAFYIRAKAVQASAPQESMQLFREYIERFPDGDYLSEAYRSMALIAKDLGDLVLAASYYRQSNVFSFGKTGSSMEIANLYFSNGDYRKAITEYTALMNQSSGTDQLLIESRIIASYYRLQNPLLASKMTQLLVAKNPPVDIRAEILIEEADYLIGMQKYQEAIGAIETVLKTYAGSQWVPRALFKKCKALELDGKSDQAVLIYQDLIKNYPTSELISDVYLSLGNYYFRKEAYDKAIVNYKLIIERYPTPVDRFQSALNNLIIANEKYGFYDRALDDLKKYIDRFPQDPEILDKKIKVGILLQKTGNYQQSVTYLSQLLQGTSGGLKAEITYYLGETYLAKGDYLKAVEVFTSIETIKNANEMLDWITSGHYMAGQAYEKAGDKKMALEYYTKIVKRAGVDPIFKKAAQKEINRLKGQ